jgi:hypothetical protein
MCSFLTTCRAISRFQSLGMIAFPFYELRSLCATFVGSLEGLGNDRRVLTTSLDASGQVTVECSTPGLAAKSV